MVTLQYYNGETWVDCGQFISATIAWISLGGDNLNYRVIDCDGDVIVSNTIGIDEV